MKKDEKLYIELMGRLIFVGVKGGTQLVLTTNGEDYAVFSIF